MKLANLFGKNQLDEMQEHTMLTIESRGFWLVWSLLLVVLLYEKVRKVEAMGGGDIKLLFVTGLFLGWKLNLLCLFAACVLGIAFGLLAPKKDGAPLFPWGPAITAAALLTVMYGQGVLDWYMGLF